MSIAFLVIWLILSIIASIWMIYIAIQMFKTDSVGAKMLGALWCTPTAFIILIAFMLANEILKLLK